MTKKAVIEGTIKDHKGNSFEYEMYKMFQASSETTRYSFALYDRAPGEVSIPDQIGSFEFETEDNSEYVSTYDIYLDVPYRGHGLYQEILKISKDYFQSIGLKGIVSHGRSRSNDATRAWSTLPGARKEPEPSAYIGSKPMDFYLEAEEPKAKNIITRFDEFKNNI